MSLPISSPAGALTAALALALALTASAGAADKVLISEFMASNTKSRNLTNQPMVDENKSYEDWIEVYNAGTEAVNLGGWALTDNPSKLRKWTFPPWVLNAGARLVVWASNKDRTDPSAPLHTNFKISSGGGYLALVKRDGVTVSHEWAPAYPPMAPDMSYGLSMDGTQPVFFSTVSGSTPPTPGGPNGAGSATIPPLVLDVPENLPAPVIGEFSQTITARVLKTQANVTGVTLAWKKMFETEVTAPMHDDGLDGDLAVGDNIWTGKITGVTLAAGQMVRWKVTATDEEGRVGKAPPNNISNTAEANASAVYYGTVAADPSLATSKLPVLHWFAFPVNTGDSDTIGRVSISYGGEFYDNVGVRLHGQSTASFLKRSYNLNFPSDRNLLLGDGRRVKDLKLLSNYADKTKARNTLAYEMYREAGVAAHFAFPVRVQRNGAFYAISDAVEDADESFLERAGLNPQGALYKLYAPLASGLVAGESGYEKKTRETEPSTELNALASGLNMSGENRLKFGYDNIDLPATVNALAALNMTSNNDTGHKNYYLFRDSGRTDEWRLLPWDVDLSFGHNWTGTYNYFDDALNVNNDASPNSAPGSGNIFFRFGYFGAAFPSAISDMYLRRLSTLRNKFIAQTGTTDWVSRRFNEMANLLDPEDVASSDADLDTAKWTAPAWKLSTAAGGNSPFRLNNTRQETARVLSDYLTVRRKYLYTTMTSLPAAQPEAPPLTFGMVDFNPGGPDSQNQEYFTIINPTNLAIDVSGWKISGGVGFVIPSGTVIPSTVRATAADPDRNKLFVARNAKGFRARTVSPKQGEKRFVVSGYDGQLSARGESLELRTDKDVLITSTSWPSTPTAAQQSLRIAEINYAPLDPTAAELAVLPEALPTDFEFIELLNTGTTPLDLSGAKFTEGVSFTIPAGITLAGGQRLVVAANVAAFNVRYPGMFAVGDWIGRLDNSGERIQLIDPAGEAVLDFSYSGDWYPAVKNSGQSLVAGDPVNTPWNGWEAAARWAASAAPGGTPGKSENAAPGMTYELWKSRLPAPGNTTVGEPGADSDQDGLTNLAEYVLATDPVSVGARPAVDALQVMAGGQFYPAIRWLRIANVTDASVTVQTSPDLSSWADAATVPAGAPVDHGNGTETVTVRLTTPAPSKFWLRLKIVK
ncbi:MAG: Spore coat protein CotH [Verrucomicrobiales bacterium]|nr:Spore coat protein CotH [Verrucomicrobiales bacterium]